MLPERRTATRICWRLSALGHELAPQCRAVVVGLAVQRCRFVRHARRAEVAQALAPDLLGPLDIEKVVALSDRKKYEQVIEINLEKIFKDGELAQNIALQPQDIVFIPIRPLSEFDIATILDVVTTGLTVYNVLLK